MPDRRAPLRTATPRVDDLGAILAAMRQWPRDGAPLQLHLGDVGWQLRFGAQATAAVLRTWHRDDRLVAVGMLDSPTLLRLGVAPDAQEDDALTGSIVGDLCAPERGVLPAGTVAVEARAGRVAGRLLERGWEPGEPWVPLARDLTTPVEEGGLRIQVTGPERAELRADLHRASFEGSQFTAGSWRAMAAGPAYRDARCLVGVDPDGNAVAAATVWSAGPGRPGLLEPLGVHHAHRRRGHGRAISLAAAATLRELGACSALVCTPAANVAAVATYRSAGFVAGPESRDVTRRAV